jgi:hypothetical protein
VYGAAVHSAKYVLYSGNKCSVLWNWILIFIFIF